MPAPTDVALAPFVQLSPGDAERRILAGLRAAVLSRLAARDGLKVFAGTFDPAQADPDGGRYRGYVVTAAVARADGAVYAAVSATQQGRAAGAAAVEARADEPNVAGALADAVASLVGAAPTAPREPPPALSRAAYERLLLARYHAARFAPADSEAAIGLFRSVLDEAPDHADALAGLAAATFEQLRYGALGADHAASVHRWAERAARLDPSNVEAHTVRALAAMYHGLDFPAAADAFRDALAVGRDHVTVLRELTWFLVALSRDADAARAADRALEYDPLSVDLLCLRADVARYTGDPARALALYDRAHALDRRYSRAVEGATAAATMLGDRDRAYAGLALYRRHEPSRYWRHRLAGEVATRFGDGPLFDRSVAALRAYARAHPEADLASDLATVLAERDPDRAMRHLADAFRRGVGVASVLRYPAFAPLRDRDDYRALVAALDLDVGPIDLAPPRRPPVRVVPEHGAPLVLPEWSLVWAEAAGNYATVHAARGAAVRGHLVRLSLDALGRQLDGQLGAGAAARVHRTALVHLARPGWRLEGTVRAATLRHDALGVAVPVSRSAVAGLRRRLGEG